MTNTDAMLSWALFQRHRVRFPPQKLLARSHDGLDIEGSKVVEKKLNREGYHARWRKRIGGNALRHWVLQLSEASELGPDGHGRGVIDVPPGDGPGWAEGDAASQVRTRFGSLTAKCAGKMRLYRPTRSSRLTSEGNRAGYSR